MAKLIPITIPKWGIEMEEGTIAEWRYAVGDVVSWGDELVDIETDKIVNSFEATHDGTLVRILAEEGDDLAVGTLIGVLATEDVSEEEIDAFIAANTGSTETVEDGLPDEADSERTEPAADRSTARISPAMRRKAERLGVDIAGLQGSGYGGRILRDDIESARDSSGLPPVRALRGSQKTIAERMTLAKQTIPHFYLQRDCNVEPLLAKLDSLRTDGGVKITVNHLLLRAVASALRLHPELNLNMLPGGVRDLPSIDVAVAVDTGDSLLTPVVRDIGDADILRIAELAGEVVDRARSGQLTQSDIGGGAITVSNLGMLGVDTFTAIINPPQVMILAVGAIREGLALINGQPASTRYMSLTLACDHRVINGAQGARFLAAICEDLEAL